MRRAVEQFALLGEDQAAGMAVEQRHLQAVFQGRDLAAHRRLAEVQQLAGMGEAARLRHRVEDAQLVPIHDGGAETPLLGQANIVQQECLPWLRADRRVGGPAGMMGSEALV